MRPEDEMNLPKLERSQNAGDLHLDQVQRRNTYRQLSSSVEVEKMKIERSETEGTHMADRVTISQLRAVATLRSQSGKNDKGSEQRSW